MSERSKVMEKWQTVIPKRIREAARIGIGDILSWRYKSGVILVTPPRRVQNPSETLYGLIPSSRDAVEEIERLRKSRLEKAQC